MNLTSNNQYGLSSEDIWEMNSFFATLPELKKVILFWSRALNTHKKASDIDIALIVEQNEDDILFQVSDHLEEETNIPYFFDVIDYNSISNVNLKKHIDKYWKVIYQKSANFKL